jgi:MarR family transcriptional regulator, 2-MHQ and catechol-resistance regulon repressor
MSQQEINAMPAPQLQHELRKKRPFDSLEEEANLNIARTSDQFQNRFGRLFREFGLTGSQYNVLRILRGEARPMQCAEIAERMVQVVPAMTGLLDRLEKQGLVRRERSTEDRRVIYVEPTDKALNLLKQMDEPVLALNQKLLGRLTKSELKELSRLLEKARLVCSEVAE